MTAKDSNKPKRERIENLLQELRSKSEQDAVFEIERSISRLDISLMQRVKKFLKENNIEYEETIFNSSGSSTLKFKNKIRYLLNKDDEIYFGDPDDVSLYVFNIKYNVINNEVYYRLSFDKHG